MSLFSTISVWWWGTKKKIGLIFWKTRTKANTVFNQSKGRHKNSKKQQANCMIWRKMWVLKYQSFSVLNLIPAATNFPKFWSEGFYSCFKYFQKIDKLWQQYKIVRYNSAIQESSCNHLSAWQKIMVRTLIRCLHACLIKTFPQPPSPVYLFWLDVLPCHSSETEI